MMTISDNSANVDFTEKEYDILCNLTSERALFMRGRLKECDPHKYIEICQLNGKLESILSMISYEKKEREKQKEEDKITEKKLLEMSMKLEDDEEVICMKDMKPYY